MDLAASIGSPVRTAGDGLVTFASGLAGRGVVTVTHGELRTTYEPVLAVVHAGDLVTAGAQIGWLATPTGHCGLGRSCLHWGLLRGSTYLDPLALLAPAHVRLLPLLIEGQSRVALPAAAALGPAVGGPQRVRSVRRAGAQGAANSRTQAASPWPTRADLSPAGGPQSGQSVEPAGATGGAGSGSQAASPPPPADLSPVGRSRASPRAASGTRGLRGFAAVTVASVGFVIGMVALGTRRQRPKGRVTAARRGGGQPPTRAPAGHRSSRAVRRTPS